VDIGSVVVIVALVIFGGIAVVAIVFGREARFPTPFGDFEVNGKKHSEGPQKSTPESHDGVETQPSSVGGGDVPSSKDPGQLSRDS
jgi:hypothetical protein